MINILIGIGVIFLFVGTVYTLGVLPNLWSNEIITPYKLSTFWDIIIRGLKHTFYVMGIVFVFFVLYMIGGMIRM